MILSGLKINEEVQQKRIYISDYDKSRLNPNSYNLRLHNELLVYENKLLNMKEDNKTRRIIIPETGLRLEPGVLYLGRTMEKTATDFYVPMIEGRSSIGRLGMTVHVTAGFGDVGFKGYWTLEIMCTNSIIIYPYIDVCQIYYHTIKGAYQLYESGKYQNNTEIQGSMLYKEF